jgi:hypothetical protein
MLRFLVLLLLVANAAYLAWAQGYLAIVGLAPALQTEPQRIQNQIKPEAIRLLSSAEAKRAQATISASSTATSTVAATSQPKPAECLQSNLLSPAQITAVQSAAASLPTSTWRLEPASEPARWIVYMGKYAGAEALNKKKAELRDLGLAFEPLKNPSLEPGLALGGYATQAQATQALAQAATRGVRTGKVVQELAERKGQILKLPAVDEALSAQLTAIKTAVGAGGLSVCKA